MIDLREGMFLLFEFVKNIGIGMSEVWEWLTTSHYIGIDLELIGLNFGFDIMPIGITGAVLVVLLGLKFIKEYIPFG